MLRATLIACALLFSTSAFAQPCEPSNCWGKDDVKALRTSVGTRMICKTVDGRAACRVLGSLACDRGSAILSRHQRHAYVVPLGYRLRLGTGTAVTLRATGGSVEFAGMTDTSITCAWSCEKSAAQAGFIRGYCAAAADKTGS